MPSEGAVLQGPHPAGLRPTYRRWSHGKIRQSEFRVIRPSDTIKTRVLHADLLVADVQRRRSVHFHVEVIRVTPKSPR